MIRGVGRIGYNWFEQCFTVDEQGFWEGYAALRDSVSRGRPVLVGLFKPPIGHTVVFAGHDESAEEVYLVDPAIPTPGRRVLSLREFKRIWRENIVDLRCGIFTRPKKKQKRNDPADAGERGAR